MRSRSPSRTPKRTTKMLVNKTPKKNTPSSKPKPEWNSFRRDPEDYKLTESQRGRKQESLLSKHREKVHGEVEERLKKLVSIGLVLSPPGPRRSSSAPRARPSSSAPKPVVEPEDDDVLAVAAGVQAYLAEDIKVEEMLPRLQHTPYERFASFATRWCSGETVLRGRALEEVVRQFLRAVQNDQSSIGGDMDRLESACQELEGQLDAELDLSAAPQAHDTQRSPSQTHNTYASPVALAEIASLDNTVQGLENKMQHLQHELDLERAKREAVENKLSKAVEQLTSLSIVVEKLQQQAEVTQEAQSTAPSPSAAVAISSTKSSVPTDERWMSDAGEDRFTSDTEATPRMGLLQQPYVSPPYVSPAKLAVHDQHAQLASLMQRTYSNNMKAYGYEQQVSFTQQRLSDDQGFPATMQHHQTEITWPMKPPGLSAAPGGRLSAQRPVESSHYNEPSVTASWEGAGWQAAMTATKQVQAELDPPREGQRHNDGSFVDVDDVRIEDSFLDLARQRMEERDAASEQEPVYFMPPRTAWLGEDPSDQRVPARCF